MEMEKIKFGFRRYQYSDLNVIYKAYEEYVMNDIQPYFNVGCGMSKSEFEITIRKYSNRVNNPPIVADQNDRAIGKVNVTYKRANKYFTLNVYMWEKKNLMKSVLCEIVNKLMRTGNLAYLLLEVLGYDYELKKIHGI